MSPSDPVGPFRYGQIVLATVGDGRGNLKTRPVVIVTPTDEITVDMPVSETSAGRLRRLVEAPCDPERDATRLVPRRHEGDDPPADQFGLL